VRAYKAIKKGPRVYTSYERVEQTRNLFPRLRDERIAVPLLFVPIFKANMVEVPGFEPGSGNLNLIVSTCLVYL